MTLVTVEVFDTEKKGRGLRATKDLAAGQVVFAEPSFAAVVFDSLSPQVCHSCFRRQEKLHRCAQCRFAHYCDRTCQRAGWEEHKQECTAIKKRGKAPNENVRLAARILWRIEKSGSIISDGQLTTVEQLQDHVTDMAPNDLKELKVNVHDFLNYWPHNGQKHGVDSISHIFGVINCNGFTLSDQRGLQAVGVGLFPNLCLVNHNCWPNCTVILNHGNQMALNALFHTQRRIELRTLEKISEGDELTVSYIDFLNVSSDRQRILRQQYFFDCTCQHCTEHLKDDLMMAVKDSNKKSDQDVKEVTEFSVKTLEKIEQARIEGNYEEVGKLCRQCLEQQEPVLGDTNLYLLRVLSVASEVLSYRHDFSEAAGYARRMVEGHMKLYHPNNAQLGMATMRAGVTLWQAGQIEAGHSMLCKANGILMITHGPSHSITKDLEAIRLQAEMELQMFQQNEAAYYSLREAALKRQPISNLAEPLEDNIRKLFRGK
ncbi:histone-lysine N-methyltransferase SMYD1-like [Paramormyrops kingsleyae]|uniref:[histone H3]-lysine(4) N-trimethyltransferase n=1 Tax=Paramormyrops kingsleyae TaxID=1676925 RepID=A0A3B3T5D6_9TELE|nr:histone-lysine N-methyltransferase SMYD1-like [Paramormyrops kingsleyae]XP_023667472.1 histone-lysine N-methyltransferase SMYD1-like [Paramormyrops kingsleyae]